MAVGAEDIGGDLEPAPPRAEPIGGAVPDENVPVAAAKPKVGPPKKAVAAPAKATVSNGRGSTSTDSKGTGAGGAAT